MKDHEGQMKTLLLATTVLATTAGFAAAEVSLSGDARMGIVYDDALDNEFSFDSRARVTFNLSGETDGGLAFGASFRADNAAGANEGLDGAVFLSGAFGTISMGDVSSAAENAVGDLAEVGYTGFSAFGGVLLPDGSLDGALGNEMHFPTTGFDEMALYEYSTGALTFYASIGQPSVGQNSFSVAARYEADTYAFALGYEDLEDEVTQVIGSAEATFSNVTVKAIYGAISGRGDFLDVDQYGLSASYTMDAVTVDGFWRTTDVSNGINVDSYGIGATYDLGGGASVEGGIGEVSDDTDSNMIADLGVNFEF